MGLTTVVLGGLGLIGLGQQAKQARDQEKLAKQAAEEQKRLQLLESGKAPENETTVDSSVTSKRTGLSAIQKTMISRRKNSTGMSKFGD